MIRRMWCARALGVLGLTIILTLAAQPAVAADEPVVVSPAADELVELQQHKDGSHFWQIELESGPYIASWEKDSGIWASPEEARAELDELSSCRVEAFLSTVGQYPTNADALAVDEDPDEYAWVTSEFWANVAPCAENTSWDDAYLTATTDEKGVSTIDIPLDRVGPGTHDLFVISLEPNEGQHPCPEYVWDDGYLEWCDAEYFVGSEVVFTVNVPFAPSQGSTLPGLEVENGSVFDQTVFSNLPLAPTAESASRADNGSLPVQLTITAIVALVLAILIALPTEMLNSVLTDNHSRIAGFVRWFLPKKKLPGEHTAEGLERAAGKKPRTPILHRLLHGVSGWWSLPLLAVGSVIAGFAEPDFGINWMSLRLVGTLFLAFLIVNLGGTFLAWFVTHRHTGAIRPRITARPVYLVLIALTVVFARGLSIDPALIFGTLLAIDYGTRLSKARSATVTVVGAVYAMLIGLGAWFGYTAIAAVSAASVTDITNMPVDALTAYNMASYAQVTLGELAAVLCVEALSTVPIVLLPMAFLSGSALWAWKRTVWVVVYAVGLAVYSFVLVPMPFAWEEISEPVVVWVSIFVGYAVFAVVVWGLFFIEKKRRLKRGDAVPPVAAPGVGPNDTSAVTDAPGSGADLPEEVRRAAAKVERESPTEETSSEEPLESPAR